MIDKLKLNSVEKDLVEGLESFLADLKTGKPIEKKYTCHRVALELAPQAYTAETVRATRELLSSSQELFARFLGVSVKTVRKWEGGNPPSDMACRFMDEIRRNPRYWQKRLRDCIVVKTGKQAAGS